MSLFLGGDTLRLWQVRYPQGKWFNSYVQTYLERDVRAVTAVKDLSTFR